jgi:uncharacterized protein (UPF0261 family)
MRNVGLIVLATKQNFDERGYLAANPDVAEAVRAGQQAKFSIGVWIGTRIGIQKGPLVLRFERGLSDRRFGF